jgi:hypothetical protein
LSFQEWVSVLKLSTLWDFQEARKCSIANLPFTDVDHPVLQIELAMTYKVRQWFFPALQKLATQAHGLKPEDVQSLGLEFALKVSELRGRVQGFERATRLSGSCDISYPAVPLADFIKELFPAAIVTGPWPGVDDSALSWDPKSLAFLPGKAPMPEDVPQPKPSSVYDEKSVSQPQTLFDALKPLFDGGKDSFDFPEMCKPSTPTIDQAPAYGPFGSPSPPWTALKPSPTLPSPVGREYQTTACFRYGIVAY